jgi:hypothetical protein
MARITAGVRNEYEGLLIVEGGITDGRKGDGEEEDQSRIAPAIRMIRNDLAFRGTHGVIIWFIRCMAKPHIVPVLPYMRQYARAPGLGTWTAPAPKYAYITDAEADP